MVHCHFVSFLNTKLSINVHNSIYFPNIFLSKNGSIPSNTDTKNRNPLLSFSIHLYIHCPWNHFNSHKKHSHWKIWYWALGIFLAFPSASNSQNAKNYIFYGFTIPLRKMQHMPSVKLMATKMTLNMNMLAFLMLLFFAILLKKLSSFSADYH